MKEAKKRRLEITTETHTLRVIRIRHSRSNSGYCRNCGKDVTVFSASQAALIFGTEEPILERLFLSNQIHEVGEAALCGSSLVDYFN